MPNWYLVATGIFYGLSTPIGVHIGYLMAQNNWTMVIIETAILLALHLVAPMLWVKAQTIDIRNSKPKHTEDTQHASNRKA